MRIMLRLAYGFCLLEFAAYAQENPLISRAHRLMGQPKELVYDLSNFPWNAESPDALPGFQRVSHGRTIRIVSVQRPVEDPSQWTRWENEDGIAWVDLVRFATPYGGAEMLQSARQVHSGYHDANQLLLFSNTGVGRREAVGTIAAHCLAVTLRTDRRRD